MNYPFAPKGIWSTVLLVRAFWSFTTKMPKYKPIRLYAEGVDRHLVSASFKKKPSSPELLALFLPPEVLAATIRAGQGQVPSPEKPFGTTFTPIDRRKGKSQTLKIPFFWIAVL